MGLRTSAAIIAAKALSLASRIAGKQGVTMAGKLALKVDPDILKKLSSQVKGPVIAVCGTNGKTTTNNLLCSLAEAEGRRVVCNKTGSNMLMGVAAAFVLSARWTGRLQADAACLEVDEASALRVFPHVKPDVMVITNLFRDQLDRYGEIDTTMDLLSQAIRMLPKVKLVINGDDSLVSYLAKESGRECYPFGISSRVISEADPKEVREGQFCKVCGEKLVYDFYHYSQLGVYHCPNCSFARPKIAFDAENIDMKNGLDFDILQRETDGQAKKEGEDAGIHIHAEYRGFYNIYNILASFGAAKAAGLSLDRFGQVLSAYDPQNGRNELFTIGGKQVLLNLAKNPAGFNQNILSVMEDPAPKDILIVINDNAQDGKDISWLWDVDFERFADPSVQSVTVSGIRSLDMGLRLKYSDIPSVQEAEVKTALKSCLAKKDTHLYVLVNYTALYSTHLILKSLSGEGV